MKFPAISVLVVLILTGCASNEPTPEMRAWIGTQLAEKQKLETAQAAHAQELARLKTENERIKAEAAAEKRQAEAVAWVASHQKQIIEELTKTYQPNMQAILEAYKFEGKALSYFVEEAMLEGKILYFSQLLIWRKPDGSGCVARIIVGQNVETNTFVYEKVVETRNIAREDLGRSRKANQSQLASSDNGPSVWTPTSETVNSGYQAAIKVAATAAGVVIMDMLTGN